MENNNITPEEITQWFINNRHNPNISDKDMFNKLYEIINNLTPFKDECDYKFYCQNKVRFCDTNYCAIFLLNKDSKPYCPKENKTQDPFPKWL